MERKPLALHEMIDALFGIRTHHYINRERATAMIATTLLVPSDPKRLCLTIFNLSAGTIYILPRNSVSVTEGVRLAASGGSVSLVWDRDFELVAMPWYCMGTADNLALTVLEVVAE